MIKINSSKMKFRGQNLTELVIFLNAVQYCNGKDIIIELYPYLSKEARKDDSFRNHLRHEIFYLERRIESQSIFMNAEQTQVKTDANGQPIVLDVLVEEWQLLEDVKIETEGHIAFFAQANVWEIINKKVTDYLVSLDICSAIDITEV